MCGEEFNVCEWNCVEWLTCWNNCKAIFSKVFHHITTNYNAGKTEDNTYNRTMHKHNAYNTTMQTQHIQHNKATKKKAILTI
jgi:hypothetical protein